MRLASVILILLMGGVIGLQAVHERRGGVPAVDSPDMLYVRSPEAMKRLALSYQSLLADIYWIRAVQHYGGTRLSNDPKASYDLLYPLLDLTTSLDPRFNVAYLFGSLFLAGPPPGGPGRPDLAIALLEKGLRAQPQKWEFAQAIGFVHYWWRQDFPEAAAWFQRAAEMPGGPFWLKSMAAVTLAEGGRRDSSRQLWQELARSEFEMFRNEGQRRLQQLDAMDQVDQLQAAADGFERQVGRQVADWDDLRRAGYLRGSPVDPTGAPYRIESGRVTLDPASRLYPLPAQPPRTQ
jgi:TPR repeat protein